MGIHLLPRLAPRHRIGAYSYAFAIAATLSLIAPLVPTPAVAQSEILAHAADQPRDGIALPPGTSSSDEKNLPGTAFRLPAQQKASLSGSGTIPFHFLAMNDAQSSSQDASQTAKETSLAVTPASRTRPSHHTLGIALAIAGTTALVAGVALYEGEQHAYCNGSSTGCNEARDTGIALMPIGGAVAVTGFYLRFHR